MEKIVHQQIKDEGRSITWLCDKMRWQRQNIIVSAIMILLMLMIC